MIQQSDLEQCSESERASERERGRERERQVLRIRGYTFFFRTSLNILSIINPIVANNGHYEERKPRGYVTYSLCIYTPLNPPQEDLVYIYSNTYYTLYTCCT